MLLPLLILQAAVVPRASRPQYWQQHISYTIDASLDEPAGVLRGTQHLVYHNRSPDTLTSLSFHLYLNAFRPGSRWSDADSAERQRRFNDLVDPDFGYNHVSNVSVMGAAVSPIYPFAPDSTIVRFMLPRPLAPGDSLVAEMEWDARPSTVPRRQGRRGRAFDFAQWYPRVVAYDKLGWQEHPLYPAGEFYGDFGDFTVRLDVPDDQVVAATGVPACGDPGWERASRRTGEAVDHRRSHYPAFTAGLSADACAPGGSGRKTIVWRAESVHHFVMSMRPDYRYEGGKWGDVSVHVLYQPGDTASWGNGIAVDRTIAALTWLDELFGPYPWPQISNVHRLEGGGTEFPMMIMDGSAGLGLIVHELGHNYLMGILANNEWREGWMDEGFTSFQTAWFFERQAAGSSAQRSSPTRDGRAPPTAAYRTLERRILDSDLDGWSEPTSLVSEKYRDFSTYGSMVYSRSQLFFEQLRGIVGDSTMRAILRTYYARAKLQHVDEATFRAVAEEVSRKDLSTFFGQWLHNVVLYDYSIGRVQAKRRAGTAGWTTRIEVVRRAAGMYPVDVMVRSRGDSIVVRADGLAEREWIEVSTSERPNEIVIDPWVTAHDWNMLNNRWRRRWLGLVDRSAPREVHLDRVFTTRAYRDRTASAFLPTVWYNEAGGVMVGLRNRSNYLGRFNELLAEINVATERCCDRDSSFGNWYVRLRNPTWLRWARTTISLDGFHLEGRNGAGIAVERQQLGHSGFGPKTFVGGSLRWVATYDVEYLDPAEYDNAGTVEAEVHVASSDRRRGWDVGGRVSLGTGIEYRNGGAGFATDDRYDTQTYGRISVEGTARRSLGSRISLGLRGFGGWVDANREPSRQRWFRIAGADAYQQLRNPFTRSRDALLTGGVHFHMPGGGNVRGFDPRLGVTAIVAGNLELDRVVLSRPNASLVRDVRLAVFGDVAWTDGFFSIRTASDVAADAGVGLRVGHRIGDTGFVTRIDFPLLVTHPDRAVGATGRGGSAVQLRWTIGLGMPW